MKKSTVLSIFVSVLGFMISLIVASWHYDGDQITYTRVYNEINNYNLTDALLYYQSQIASLDLVHFYYIYIFSVLNIEKNTAMGIANSAIIFLCSKTIFRYIRPSFIAALFIISNYYILSLSFTLERFKFAVLFIFLALYLNKHVKLRIMALVLSVAAHYSILILIIIGGLYFVFQSKKESRIHAVNTVHLPNAIKVFTLMVLIFFVLINIETFGWKLDAYLLNDERSNTFSAIFKTFIMFLIAWYVVGNCSPKLISIFAPLILLSFLIEPARINFFAYLFLLYFTLTSTYLNRKIRVLLLSSIYFSSTGIIYLIMLYNYGG